MSRVTVTESYLQAIAGAIRGKNGSSDTYTPAQMAAAITAIPTGSSAPVLESLSVTENGTYTPGTGVDGFSSVTVNVPSGGGIAAGTSAPSNLDGNDGDVYFQYAHIGSEAMTHTYTLTIVSALRGSSPLTYAGATEIDLIFDDGNDGEASIRQMSGFTYSAYNGSGNTVNPSSAFDGNTGTYWETSPTQITLSMSAVIPAGYTPKTLKVMQRGGTYSSDVWKEFGLTDQVGSTISLIADAFDLTVSDWAGSGNWTSFPCSGGVSGDAITKMYVKESGGWVTRGYVDTLNAVFERVK